MLTIRDSSHKLIKREALNEIEVIRPDRVGNRWKGVQHGFLANTIVGAVESRGIKILEERWYVNGKDLSKLQGSLNVQIPDMKTPLKDMNFSLGVLHSNNADIAIRFAVGAHIIVCGNGMVTGDFVLSKKHTTNLELPEQVNLGIERFLHDVGNVQGVVHEMQEKQLQETDVDRMLMQAGRNRLMPWSRIGMVDKEFHKSRFSEFKGKSAWDLYNAFTFVEQKCRPVEQIRAMRDFKNIVLN